MAKSLIKKTLYFVVIILSFLVLFSNCFADSSSSEEGKMMDNYKALSVVNLCCTVILAITSIISTYMAAKTVSYERGPKLYIECILKEIKYGESDSYIIDNGEKINFINEGYKTLMSDIDIDYEDTGEGFVYRNSEFSKNILILKIANNGRVPARYIKIDYNIVLYKNLIKYGEDGSVVSYKPVVHKNVSRKLEINYLPPNRNQYIAILYTNSYPKIDIVINSLKCKDNRFISKKTIVYTYKHKEFDYIKDSPHLQRLLGILE